ncbi:hypothetical protein TNCV_3681981 [Trichonephila clavipes]|uniref:Uncharacterized protein n=1 Tax=Trichonephila clavipes TaxID=2585209 RepID=A0A8X6RFI1_TRICX|nr:hypothetical protein TNCV_3681981 [Trichonephila clavipes]
MSFMYFIRYGGGWTGMELTPADVARRLNVSCSEIQRPLELDKSEDYVSKRHNSVRRYLQRVAHWARDLDLLDQAAKGFCTLHEQVHFPTGVESIPLIRKKQYTWYNQSNTVERRSYRGDAIMFNGGNTDLHVFHGRN